MRKEKSTTFKVTIDLEFETIRQCYKHHFGQKKNPTRAEIASWIGSLATADIESEIQFLDNEEEND